MNDEAPDATPGRESEGEAPFDGPAHVAATLAERIGREGPIGFDAFMDTALYDPAGGFFATGGPGRAGADFITSPEVGPLFGAVMARALDAWWYELGKPDPFVVVDAGAGRGALAISVVRAPMACAPALLYVLVERSAAARERQRDHLTLVPPAHAFGSASRDGEELAPLDGHGPVVVSLEDLPALRSRGVVVANELLDNLPFRLLEHRGGQWWEIRVGLDGEVFVEVPVAAHPTLSGSVSHLGHDLADGARVPVHQHAIRWLHDATRAFEQGRLVAFDYASTTDELARRQPDEWLRTYRAHGRGGPPLTLPGAQDITCDVAVDQLARVHRLEHDESQADFLRRHGIDELVEEGRRRWEASASAPDLAAIEARSRITEADALLDPTGLGAHRVLTWEIHR